MPLDIFPPLLNSACPWATTEADILALWNCPYTGAVTTRTTLFGKEGFAHDDAVHQVGFFSPIEGAAPGQTGGKTPERTEKTASLNTFGYSPYPIAYYLGILERLPKPPAPLPGHPWGANDGGSDKPATKKRNTGTGKGKDSTEKEKKPSKLFIISVTGSAALEIFNLYEQIGVFVKRRAAALWERGVRVGVEINLSCPNVGGTMPGYSKEGMLGLIHDLSRAIYGEREEARAVEGERQRNPIIAGVKLPPYTHAGQFEEIGNALLEFETTDTWQQKAEKTGSWKEKFGEEAGFSGGGNHWLGFVTCTNTLGSCLVLSEGGECLGGMAGTAIHPLSLGNVKIMRGVLDAKGMEHVGVIGVGGVEGVDGYRRMRSVGAEAVGLATALGRMGMEVFGGIGGKVGEKW